MSETPNPNDVDTASGPSPNGSPEAPAAPSEELQEAQRQRDEYYDLLQRTRAEFTNYQKRSRAQADADRAYAVGSLARDLLDVLDNCERGAEAARSAEAPSIAAGFEMVHKQLQGVLAKHGIEPIPALGQPFDPNRHEAIVQQPDADHPEGTVVAEFSKGYQIRDRVLRPSKVAVSVKPAESA